MRPRLNEFLLDRFDSTAVLYLFPSSITIYFVAVAVITWLFLERCRRTGLDVRGAAVTALLAVAGGLAGARVYYLLHHFEYVTRHPEVIYKFGAGIASFGAYIGGLLPFVFYLHARKLDPLPYLDVLASVLGLGPFFIRWACFMNGCCYGTPTGLPWAVRYPVNSFAFRSHAGAGLIDAGGTYSLPVHPVQVYLSLFGLVVFVAASWFWKRYREHGGATFVFYWFVYGAGRFVLEFMRGDVPRYTPFGLTLSQIVILIVVGASSGGWWFLFRRATAGRR